MGIKSWKASFALIRLTNSNKFIRTNFIKYITFILSMINIQLLELLKISTKTQKLFTKKRTKTIVPRWFIPPIFWLTSLKTRWPYRHFRNFMNVCRITTQTLIINTRRNRLKLIRTWSHLTDSPNSLILTK